MISTEILHSSLFTIHSSLNTLYGGVAQLGEHLPCKQGVKGSIPFISTSRQSRRKGEVKRNTEYRITYGLIAQLVRALG